MVFSEVPGMAGRYSRTFSTEFTKNNQKFGYLSVAQNRTHATLTLSRSRTEGDQGKLPDQPPAIICGPTILPTEEPAENPAHE